MTLSELQSIVLIESGQYVLGMGSTFMKTGDSDFFKLLVNRELKYYSKYNPLTGVHFGELHNGMKFIGAGHPIPKAITNIYYDYGDSKTLLPLFIGLANYREPVNRFPNSLWTYKNKTLICKFPSGEYTYDWIAEHSMVEIEGGCDYDMPGISESDSSFINLVVGKFMLSLGRSRRSTILQDSPFELDYDSLVSEGDELYQSTKESLQEKSKFWRAII